MRPSSIQLFRLLPLAALAAAVSTPPLPALAQLRRVVPTGSQTAGSMGIPQPEPKVTLNVKQRSLGRILDELIHKQSGYKFAIRAGETGTQLYDLNVQGMPLSRALTMLLAQDKNPEPLVWSFAMSPTGEGTFNIDREYITLGNIEGENKVSLSNARITQVLPLLFKQMKVQGRVEPDVPPVLLTLELRPEKWDNVLPQLILEAYKREPGITYSMDGDTYVIHLHKVPLTGGSTSSSASGPNAPRRVKLSVAKAPLRDALAQLFQGSTWKYEVSPAVKDVEVTYAGNNEPEFGVLTSILRQASASGPQVTYREGKGVVYVEPGPLPGEIKLSARGGLGQQRTSTLTATQKPLRQTIMLFSRATGATVKIAPNIPDLPVTLSVKDATTDEFLRALIDAARTSIPNLTYKVTGENTYTLELGTGM